MKRKGMLIGMMVMSVGGLVVDRLVLSDAGPSAASASDLMAVGAAALSDNAGTAATTAPAQSTADNAAVRRLVSSLAGNNASQADALGDPAATSLGPGTPDAFALPEWLAPTPAPAAIPNAAAQAPDPVLTAVLSAGSAGAAVIDGVPIRVGQTVGGVTLIDVRGDRAVIGTDGREVSLRLSR